MIMSFIGCIGNLMEGSGLAISDPGYSVAGILKLLSEKKYPENIKALRFVVEELLKTTTVFKS